MLDELYILSSNIRLISNRGLVWFYFINNKYQTELLHRAGLKPIKPTAANSQLDPALELWLFKYTHLHTPCFTENNRTQHLPRLDLLLHMYNVGIFCH